VTPRRVLPGEPDHELTDHRGHTGTAADWVDLRRIGPVPSNQPPMPPKQNPRRHDPHPQQLTRQQPSQCREHQPILRLPPRARHLPSQHRHLMPQHHQLDILGRPATSTGHDQREHHPQGRVQSRQKHPDDHAEPAHTPEPRVIEPHTLGRGPRRSPPVARLRPGWLRRRGRKVLQFTGLLSPWRSHPEAPACVDAASAFPRRGFPRLGPPERGPRRNRLLRNG
jgi:hypothetical protein